MQVATVQKEEREREREREVVFKILHLILHKCIGMISLLKERAAIDIKGNGNVKDVKPHYEHNPSRLVVLKRCKIRSNGRAKSLFLNELQT